MPHISQAAARTGCKMTLYSSLQYFEDLEEIRRYAAMGRLGVERYEGLFFLDAVWIIRDRRLDAFLHILDDVCAYWPLIELSLVQICRSNTPSAGLFPVVREEVDGTDASEHTDAAEQTTATQSADPGHQRPDTSDKHVEREDENAARLSGEHPSDSGDLLKRMADWNISDLDSRPQRSITESGGVMRRDSVDSATYSRHIVGAGLLDGCEQHIAACAVLFNHDMRNSV
jgi:hypothetical protein